MEPGSLALALSKLDPPVMRSVVEEMMSFSRRLHEAALKSPNSHVHGGWPAVHLHIQTPIALAFVELVILVRAAQSYETISSTILVDEIDQWLMDQSTPPA